jgi:hypothetical protein
MEFLSKDYALDLAVNLGINPIGMNIRPVSFVMDKNGQLASGFNLTKKEQYFVGKINVITNRHATVLYKFEGTTFGGTKYNVMGTFTGGSEFHQYIDMHIDFKELELTVTGGFNDNCRAVFIGWVIEY